MVLTFLDDVTLLTAECQTPDWSAVTCIFADRSICGRSLGVPGEHSKSLHGRDGSVILSFNVPWGRYAVLPNFRPDVGYALSEK
jgi:hypothetical protein